MFSLGKIGNLRDFQFFFKEENKSRPERPVFIFIAILRSCSRFDVVYFDEIIQFHNTNFMYTELFSER